MNNAVKYATIIGVLTAIIVAAFSGLAWVMSKSAEYGKVQATVDQHTETLKRIETKVDMILGSDAVGTMVGRR